MDISQKIRQLRINAKMEQTELSEKIGMSSAMISMYELGKKKPTLKAIEKMAVLFNVSTNYFFNESENTSNTKTESMSISEKMYNELKVQIDFLQKNFERVLEENGRLTQIVENLTSSGGGRSVKLKATEQERIMLYNVA